MKKIIVILSLIISTDAFAQINWRVNNPFRLIDYDNTKADYSISPNQTAFDFVTAKLSNQEDRLSPPFADTHWKNGFSKDYVFPEKINATAKVTENEKMNCKWTYQGYSKVASCADEFLFEAMTQFGTKDTELKVEILETKQVFIANTLVKDRLVLGLGDSYASGEGNPDSPTIIDESKLNRLAGANQDIYSTGRWTKVEKNWVKKDADWFDRQCHRSLLSQHVLAAQRLATANPHESVTLIPLACSGAEILDGILTPQKSPPGGGKTVKKSQINFAVETLCKESSIETQTAIFYRGTTGKSIRKAVHQDMYRCKGELRKPDIILLSVGGNDVGFASVIAWATLPSGYRNPAGHMSVNITNRAIRPVCPKVTGQKICSSNAPVARDRVKYWLPDYYQWLSEQLKLSGLLSNSRNLYLTAYPNPTFIEDGRTYCDKDRSEDIGEQARTRIPRLFRTQVWDLGITKGEMEDIHKGLIIPLYQQMKQSSNAFGWNFVDSHLDSFDTHGICAGFKRTNPSTPIYPHIREGKWYPESPANLTAYDTSRERWFRNTNDSILFQTDSTKGDMNGSFHPDFRGHATIADHLYRAIKVDWSKERH